jgi:hypothetical protein
MRRRPEAPPRVFTTGRIIKPAQPFAKLHLSEQVTLSPPPLEEITTRTTEKLFHFGDDTPGAPTWLRKALPEKHIYQKGKRSRKKRRIILSIVCAFLAIVVVGGIIVATTVQNLVNSNSPLAAPPTIQVAIDAQAIHNLIASSLDTSQDSVSDINIIPQTNNGVRISLTMLISGSGINRKLPMEIDITLGGSMQPHKNILTIQRFIRDGVDAGPQAAANMQATINELLEKVLPLPGSTSTLDLASVMGTPGSIEETSSRACGHGSILLQLGLPLQVQLGLPLFSRSYVLQVGVDSYLGLDQKGNLLFHLDRITYGNGSGIGTLATNAARQVIGQLFTQSGSSSSSSSGPSLSAAGPISQIKLLSLSTTSQMVCGKSTEMVVMNLGPAPRK